MSRVPEVQTPTGCWGEACTHGSLTWILASGDVGLRSRPASHGLQNPACLHGISRDPCESEGVLPRTGSLRALLALAAAGLMLAPMTAAHAEGWSSTNWTGVVNGAPMPGEGLSAPMPAPLSPAPYLPITYDGQTGCDSTPKPGAVAFSDLIKATYGSQEYVGIPRGCDVGGRSEHKEGRAIDWMVDVREPAERAKAEAFLNWLLGVDQAGRPHGHALQLGVMYIGWHDRMWRGYDTGSGWTELKGCFSKPEKKYDNYCHRNHIHISLTWPGANLATAPNVPAPPAPVVPETPAEPAAPPRPAAPAQLGEDTDEFMSIGAQAGLTETDMAPLQPGEVRTVDLAPVPLDASSALVVVTTTAAPKKGSLRIGMVDAKSAVKLKVPKKRSRTSVIEVPVAQGRVQIAGPAKGSVAVQVDVLGYTVAGGTHRAIGTKAVKLSKASFAPGEVQVAKVRGVGPVPRKTSKATAVILRVTTKGKGSFGRFAAYPVGGADLGTTSASVSEKGKRSSVIAADIGDDGQIALASSAATKATIEIIGFVKGKR